MNFLISVWIKLTLFCIICVSADFIRLCVCRCRWIIVCCYALYRIIILLVEFYMCWLHLCLRLLIFLQKFIMLLYCLISHLIVQQRIVFLQKVNLSPLLNTFRHFSWFLVLVKHKQTELILWFILRILIDEWRKLFVKFRKWLIVFASVLRLTMRLQVGQWRTIFYKPWLSVFWYSHSFYLNAPLLSTQIYIHLKNKTINFTHFIHVKFESKQKK